MAVSSRGYIVENDMRRARFFAHYLKYVKNFEIKGLDKQDPKTVLEQINISQQWKGKSKDVRDVMIKEMGHACDENLLPATQFEWLRSNIRATFWLWAYLCKSNLHELGFDSEASEWAEPSETGKLIPYSFMDGRTDSPSTHEERIDLIISLFDTIILPVADAKMRKHSTMQKSKSRWGEIYNRPTPVKWLPENDEDACKWIWATIKEKQQSITFHLSGGMGLGNRTLLATWFTPKDHAERLLAIRGACDLWEDSDSKQLLLLNLNKAWNQRKLRQSRTDKKALNSYLKNETKEHLDELAAFHHMRISDVLEMLINEHYLRITGDGVK